VHDERVTAESRPPEPVTSRAPPLTGRQIMHQRWEDVCFLHWRVEPERVAPLLPPGIRPDVFDGSAWVGLIPFRMVGAGPWSAPSAPWLGTFAETNVRLYSVDGSGRRGVVFRSLETSRLAIVFGARVTFGVPYCWAKMRVRRVGDRWEYASTRRWPAGRGLSSLVVVRPENAVVHDDPLADFLTARWGLHSRWAGRSLFVPNSHETWRLQPATLLHLRDDLVAAAGLPGVTDRPPESVLWSAGVRSLFGAPFDHERRGRTPMPGG
jgi:uncharacterized protein YqjF (DUF2071 family)